MNKKLLLLLALFSAFFLYSQDKNLWREVKEQKYQLSKYADREDFPEEFISLKLDFTAAKSKLSSAPDRFKTSISNVVMTFPDADGNFEDFYMFEATNFEPGLQEKFPEIRSYVGVGVNSPSSIMRISVDPRGINGMVFRADKRTEFFEPLSQDGTIYAFFKSNRIKEKKPFTCSTPEEGIEMPSDLAGKAAYEVMASDGRLLTFRTAVSCTGEYTLYHGGTKAGAMAAINTTMTRVNGVYEKDFAIRMVLVANNDAIVYLDPATDPYTTNYNTQVQNTLTSVIGEANYDVGHLFVRAGDNGNAGCIGCVCVNGSKGSAFTATDPPVGEKFDIDYVAHEFGHQFGGRHTFSHASEGPNFAQKEVGGGTTIMGYAGITNQNAALASDDHFHAASIQQVQANMVGKTCPTSTTIIHSAPVVNAGFNYTIPRSTPFMLTGSATDIGGGNLTYCWEQFDTMGGTQTGAASAASETKASGPNFRSYSPTTNPTRYFPKMSSVLSGSRTTFGSNIIVEALSSVARTLNFRLTVRDNVVGLGQTNFADMVVTVDATRGPLVVTSQNTDGISYDPGTDQTITWNVNSTNTSAGGANVDIMFSSDNGETWSTILANTPNDGSEVVTLPNILAPYCRFMVKASDNIFFNVNTSAFAVGYTVTKVCTDYTRTNSPAQAMATGWTGYLFPAPTEDFIITDARFSVVCTAQRTNQVSFAVIRPNITVVDILAFDGPNSGCGAGVANLNVVFDDAGAAFSCAATNVGATYAPVQPLSTLVGMSSLGNWRFAARSTNTANTISSATLTLCRNQETLNVQNVTLNDFVIYPNPNTGNFNVQFSSNSGNEIKVLVHDIRGRQIFERSFNNSGLFNENINLSNVQSGIYMVTVLDGAQKQVKKIVVE
jgi:hypothetical protein